MKKLIASLILILGVVANVVAQEDAVEMADTFYKEGKIYVVVVVAAIVFVCVALYLVLLDRKIKKLEKKTDEIYTESENNSGKK